MKLVVKVGNVYSDGSWDRGTYFETDEEYETSCEDIQIAEQMLLEEYNGVYSIGVFNGVVVAYVF
jgi:hypothetical protein